MHVLVVEDDPKMGLLLMRGFTQQGFDAQLRDSGEAALDHTQLDEFDVIVLDVTLPGIDGVTTCRQLRSRGLTTPVLMLTARVTVQDRVRGLDAGADDYLDKPFAFAELLARVRAVTRRGTDRRSIVQVGELRLDTLGRRAWRGDTEIALSRREFALLEALMLHPDQVLTRAQLIQHAWPYTHDGGSNVVDVYIRYLREKVDLPFGTASVQTVRGVGYRLNGG